MGATSRWQNKRSGKSPNPKSFEHVGRANERGIVAARRPVSQASLPLMERVIESLDSELAGCGRVISARDCGVTVVGFYHFDKRIRSEGPSTRSVSKNIASTFHPLEVGLGSLAFYGQKYKVHGKYQELIGGKLAIELMSGELMEEEARYRKEYVRRGAPLREHPLSRGYCPHISVAVVFNQARELSDPRSIKRMNAAIGLGRCSMESLILDPVLRENPYPDEKEPCSELMSPLVMAAVTV